MRPFKRVANPSLAALVLGSGFPSVERFAEAVNELAWQRCGVKLSYDHVRVKRWIAGGSCQYPDVVTAVLSRAWGIPIPVSVIWPELRNGNSPVPAHLQAWVPERTVEDLGIFLRCDMLSRRETLASLVGVVSGAALLNPIAAWLTTTPPVWDGPAAANSGRIGVDTVMAIERATHHFATDDAALGGGLSREAAVGQLKYASDLVLHARYGSDVGNRLLAAVAELADTVGWMTHDVGMDGPAQRYLLYGLQAARESHDVRARLVRTGLLADLARQMLALDQPETGLRLVELALAGLPANSRAHRGVRSLLWNLKGHLLARLDPTNVIEVRASIGASFDLYAQSEPGDVDEEWQVRIFPYLSAAQLHAETAATYLNLAAQYPEMANYAEEHALLALSDRPTTFARSRVFDQISLAQARFGKGDLERACDDADVAITWAAEVPASRRTVDRLGQLISASAPYLSQERVRHLHERLKRPG